MREGRGLSRSVRNWLFPSSRRASPEFQILSGDSSQAHVAPETAAFTSMSTDRALWRVACRGMEIATVIDVGASNGMWSAVCERHFPAANYLLVEAQSVHKAALEEYCRERKNASYVLAAAGSEIGEIFFDDADPFGGVASSVRTVSANTVVPVTTIDHEVERIRSNGPYLIKLDTHGFEVPILMGARQTLASANLVVIETYNFRISPGALLMHEMIAYMSDLGFGVIDMSEPLWREKDLSFWQIDVLFQPKARPEFSYTSYR